MSYKALLIVFAILSTSQSAFAGKNIETTSLPNYSSCGTKPGVISKLISDADEMREKCINDVYREYLEERDKEVRELHEYSKYLEQEVKKVAVKATIMLVDCGVETKRKPELVFRCRQLNAERNAVISRIDRLMGWDQNFRTAAAKNVPAKDLPAPPCPSSTELNEIKGIRYFNKKLYQTWERCVSLR